MGRGKENKITSMLTVTHPRDQVIGFHDSAISSHVYIPVVQRTPPNIAGRRSGG